MGNQKNNKFIKINYELLKRTDLTNSELLLYSVLQNERDINRIFNNKNYTDITDTQINKKYKRLSLHTIRRGITKLKKYQFITCDIKRINGKKRRYTFINDYEQSEDFIDTYDYIEILKARNNK